METMINKELASALKKNPYFLGSVLKFQWESGRVIVQGTVPSYYIKQMVQETVRTFQGVGEIKNEVQVSAFVDRSVS